MRGDSRWSPRRVKRPAVLEGVGDVGGGGAGDPDVHVVKCPDRGLTGGSVRRNPSAAVVPPCVEPSLVDVDTAEVADDAPVDRIAGASHDLELLVVAADA